MDCGLSDSQGAQYFVVSSFKYFKQFGREEFIRFVQDPMFIKPIEKGKPPSVLSPYI